MKCSEKGGQKKIPRVLDVTISETQRSWIVANMMILTIISVTGNVTPAVGEFSPPTGFERLDCCRADPELSLEETVSERHRGGAFPTSPSPNCLCCFRGLSQYLFWAPEAEGNVLNVLVFP